MITTEIDKSLDIDKVSNLTILNQLCEVLYVNQSVGQIFIDKISKENSVVKNVSNILEYKLKTHKLIIKKYKNNKSLLVISDIPNIKTLVTDLDIPKCILSNINSIFLSELNINSIKENFNYYKQNHFKKLISPNTEVDLFNKIINVGKDFSWIILPKSIITLLQNYIIFENINDNENDCKLSIVNIGKMNNMNVYTYDTLDSKTIYFGNYDSFTIIVNNNIKEEEVKDNNSHREEKTICIDYLFIKNNNIKSLNII